MTANPLDQSHAAIAARDLADEIGGAIGRVVVDELLPTRCQIDCVLVLQAEWAHFAAR